MVKITKFSSGKKVPVLYCAGVNPNFPLIYPLKYVTLKIKNHAFASQKNILSAVGYLYDFFQSKGINFDLLIHNKEFELIFKSLSDELFLYYIPSSSKDGISGAVQNAKLQAILNFINYCIDNVITTSHSINKNLIVKKYTYQLEQFKHIYSLKEDNSRTLFRSLTDEQVDKLTDLIHPDNANNPFEESLRFRNALIIYILLESLEKVANKLFFPKFSDRIPSYLISNDDDLIFYNGQAIIGHSAEEMLLVNKILESRLFWYYIKTTSKPYSSDYYSLNGT